MIEYDLLHLEINTIIKSNITGCKMPHPTIALIEIAKKFNVKLAMLGDDIDREENNLGSYGSYKALYDASENRIERLKAQSKRARGLEAEDEVYLWMLYRIKSTSEMIMRMLETLNPKCVNELSNKLPSEIFETQTRSSLLQLFKKNASFNSDQVVAIRKAWELGIEEIAMQTIVQLDGDVMTRIQPYYAKNTNSAVHEIHHQTVGIALQFWKTLIEITGSLLKGAVKLLPL
jgi:hypothetical protein